MSGLVKLVNKFLVQQNSITIQEVRRLLEEFGYSERKKPGSECTFHKKGSYPINVPTVKGRAVKSCYIKRLVRILELEVWYEQHKGE